MPNFAQVLRLFYPSDHYRFCVILSVSFATAFIEDHYESGTEQSADIAEPGKIEEGLFRGQSEDLGLRQVFGGQVVGQALYAAKETVPADRLVHSFHSYFLRPGDSAKPIVYDVEVLRDGQSFSARRVAAIQHGKPIFYMTASFQAPEPGYEHQKRCRLPRRRTI